MNRFFKYTLGSSAIGLLVVTGFFYYRIAQFRAAVENLRQAGQPVSLVDFRQQFGGVPDVANPDASTLLARAERSLLAFEAELYQDEEIFDREVDDQVIARFEELEKAYPDLFPAFDAIADAPQAILDFGADPNRFLETSLNQMSDVRSCTRLLAMKARILAAQGKTDDALRCGIRSLKIIRKFDDAPTLVNHLVLCASRGNSIQSLNQLCREDSLSDEIREDLNRELEQHGSAKPYQISLIGERAFVIDTFEQQGIFVMAHSAGYFEPLDQEIDSVDAEGNLRPRPLNDQNAEFAGGAMGQQIVPAILSARGANIRTRSQIRALRILNALQTNQADFPANISQDALIKMGVPEKMTRDPVNGQPMIVKQTETGWLIYSVGLDGQDDGGELDTFKDFGVGPPPNDVRLGEVN